MAATCGPLGLLITDYHKIKHFRHHFAHMCTVEWADGHFGLALTFPVILTFDL